MITTADARKSDAALDAFLHHAAEQSPYYRDFPWAKILRQGKSVRLHEITVTAKETLRANSRSFHANAVPASEGKVFIKHTSGSTGAPLEIHKTQRHFFLNKLENDEVDQAWQMAIHRKA